MERLLTKIFSILFITFSFTAACALTHNSAHSTILFIWDSLRPESISKSNTPNLYQLQQSGTWFADHHSSPFILSSRKMQLPSHIRVLRAVSSVELAASDDEKNNVDFVYPDNITPNPVKQKKINNYCIFIENSKQSNSKLKIIKVSTAYKNEHQYGIGSPYYNVILHQQDALLGMFLKKIKKTKKESTTNIVIISEHGRVNVSGPLKEFPLRTVHHSMPGTIDDMGYSVSGDFRPADLLAHAGFHVYDDQGCIYDPVMLGIKKNGSLVYDVKIDKEKKICHRSNLPIGNLYSTPDYTRPKKIKNHSIRIENHGGMTYFYVDQHEIRLIKKLVCFLQSREEFGPLFVTNAYDGINGTFPLSWIIPSMILGMTQKNAPDVVAGSNDTPNDRIFNLQGIAFNSGPLSRSVTHSLDPHDIHSIAIASGPDFKSHFVDRLPTSNEDIESTINYLLKKNLNKNRILFEALAPTTSKKNPTYQVYSVVIKPAVSASFTHYYLATNPYGQDVDCTKKHYTIKMKMKILMAGNIIYRYIDSVRAFRY